MSTVFGIGDGTQGLIAPHMKSIDHCFSPSRMIGLPSDIYGVSAVHYHSRAWGVDSFSSRKTWRDVEGLDICVKMAHQGVVSAAIGDDGSLWVWGMSRRGLLGLGEGVTRAIVPRKIEALEGEKIVKVSFGRWHAHAQTKDGKLFKWGYSSDCRIGKVDEAVEASPKAELDLYGRKKPKGDIIWEPCLVQELQGINVVDYACGTSHSFVLCCNGALLCCGNNVYGQLGGVNPDLETFPPDISFHPTSIGSGRSHSFPIADHIGAVKSLVSWGWNRNSKLGSKGPRKIPRNSKFARKGMKSYQSRR